jgi:hypothetical protein
MIFKLELAVSIRKQDQKRIIAAARKVFVEHGGDPDTAATEVADNIQGALMELVEDNPLLKANQIEVRGTSCGTPITEKVWKEERGLLGKPK